MPTWLRVLVYSSVVFFCTVLGGGIGIWLPARGTEKDTGAAGVADGMTMIMFGTLGLVIGLVIGFIIVGVLWSLLNKSGSAETSYAYSPEKSGKDIWPPPPKA